MASKFQLKNGLTVLLFESHKSPVVSVQMWVKTGSADELKGQEGISHFIEHLVFKGTRKYGVGEIAATVEGSGGELNAYTSFDQTVFYVTISKQFLDIGVDVISEMMGFPSFVESEIDNEREVVIEEIKRSNDSPGRQASRQLFSSVYKKHPYGIPVIGYDENIRSFTPKAIADYYATRYVPENMTLVMVGDFSSKEIAPLVRKKFSEFKASKLRKVRRPAEAKQTKARVSVQKTKFKESFLNLAWRTPKATHKDTPALDLLGMILGQGDSSRLSKTLRLDRPLTNYAVASSFNSLDPGFFAVSCSLEARNLSDVLEGVLQELERMLLEPPAPEEIQKVLVNVESEEFYSLETVDGLSRKLGTYEHLFSDYRVYQKILKATMALGPQDIIRVARKYLRPETLSVSLMLGEGDVDGEALVRDFVKRYKRSFSKKPKALKKSKSTRRRNKIHWSLTGKKADVPARLIDLPGGGKLILRPSAETPIVNVRTAFLGGLRAETPEKGGLTELVSRVWVSATRTWGERELHDRIDSMAASLSSYGGRNTIGISSTFLSPFSEEMLEMFNEVHFHPRVTDEIVERERTLMLNQIRSREDSPAQVAIQNFLEEAFPGHPYGRQMQGEEESVRRLTTKDVEEYLASLLKRGNMNLVVAGDVDASWWTEKAMGLQSEMPNGKAFDAKFKKEAPHFGASRFAHNAKEQSHIVMGYPGLTFTDPDRYVLQVIQAVLAGQGGRLFFELRDRESLAYSVSPLRMDGIDCGYFGAYIGCSPEKAKKAIAMLKKEILRLADEQVPAEELERAQRYLIGRHDIDLQKTSTLAAAMLYDQVYGLRFDETFRYPEHVRAVTPESVRKLAQSLFSVAPIISVVGPTRPD